MKESSSLRWIAFVRPAVGLFAVLSNRKLVRENAEGFELGNDDIPYIKIVNKNIFVEDHTASSDRNEFKEGNLWVDVFCWDNVPMNFTKLRYAYFKSYIRHAWGCKRAKKYNVTCGYNNPIHHKIVEFLFRNYSLEELTFKYIEYWKKFNKTESQFINNNTWGDGLKYLPKELMTEFKSVLDKLRIRQMAREKQKSSQEQSADMERNRK